MVPWEVRPKQFQTSVVVPPAPVWVPTQSPLVPSVSSVTSVANDKGDIEMIPGAVHISPGICLKAEENIYPNYSRCWDGTDPLLWPQNYATPGIEPAPHFIA